MFTANTQIRPRGPSREREDELRSPEVQSSHREREVPTAITVTHQVNLFKLYTHGLSNLHSRFLPELSSPLWSLARQNLYLPTHSRRAWKWWRSPTSSLQRSTHIGWCTLTSRLTCLVSESRSEKKIIMALNTYNMTGQTCRRWSLKRSNQPEHIVRRNEVSDWEVPRLKLWSRFHTRCTTSRRSRPG